KVNSNTNSFMTLPDTSVFYDAELNPDGLFNFSFEIGTGNNQNRGRGDLPPTYTNMLNDLKDRIYFQIQNGDWIYEEGRETTSEQWAATVGVKAIPSMVNLAKGITGVWENYKIYLTRSQSLANFYREVPQFVVIDDHEILNDVIGSGQTGIRVDSRDLGWQENIYLEGQKQYVERAVFRDPASEAWNDYVGWSNPDIGILQSTHFGMGRLKKGSDILTDPDANFTGLDRKKISNLHVLWGYGNSGVYEIVEVLAKDKIRISPSADLTERVRYSIGTNRYSNFRVGNTEFFLLDTRSNRTLHDKSNPDDPNTSMLGKVQKEWLFKGLRQSEADIIFIVSSVNFAIPHDNGAWYNDDERFLQKDDGWTAHLHEREQMIELAESLNKPVFFLTGDLHRSFVARITPAIYDIGCGPHTSRSHRMGDAGGSPPSGWYDSGGRLINLIWTSRQFRNDNRRPEAPGWPIYTLVRVNNVYNIPDDNGNDRWIAYPEPQIILEFHDGFTGELAFAYSVSTSDAKAEKRPVPLERVKVMGGIKK
ncbi:alkaline phosphatase D family protein, partial [Bacteroidota bacterium]